MATRHSNGIAAVGYARRSTDLQERSIPDQQAYVEKWAKEHGYRIVRWFIDDATQAAASHPTFSPVFTKPHNPKSTAASPSASRAHSSTAVSAHILPAAAT